MSDSLLRLLHGLPEAEPDSDRAARIRERCHAVLAAQAAALRPVRPAADSAADRLRLDRLPRLVRAMLRAYGIL
jgi:hypothetical protein